MYKDKYLKYKQKYLNLKIQIGGDLNIIAKDFYETLSIVDKANYILGKEILSKYKPITDVRYLLPFVNSSDYYLSEYLGHVIQENKKNLYTVLDTIKINTILNKDILEQEEYTILPDYYKSLYDIDSNENNFIRASLKYKRTMILFNNIIIRSMYGILNSIQQKEYINLNENEYIKKNKILEDDLINDYIYTQLTPEEKTLFVLYNITTLDDNGKFIAIYIKNLEIIKRKVILERRDISIKEEISYIEYYKLNYNDQLSYEKIKVGYYNKIKKKDIIRSKLKILDHVRIEYCSLFLKNITKFIFGGYIENYYSEASIIADRIKTIDRTIFENILLNTYKIIEIAYSNIYIPDIYKFFSFVKPSKTNIEIIKKYTIDKKIIELFAGYGLWAALLRLNGCDIIPIEPSDSTFYNKKNNSFVKIEHIYDIPSLLKTKNEVLFFCYPYMNDDAYEALKNFKDNTFIYIGTHNKKQNASKKFFDLLNGKEDTEYRWITIVNKEIDGSGHLLDGVYLQIYLKLSINDWNKIDKSIKTLQRKFLQRKFL